MHSWERWTWLLVAAGLAVAGCDSPGPRVAVPGTGIAAGEPAPVKRVGSPRDVRGTGDGGSLSERLASNGAVAAEPVDPGAKEEKYWEGVTFGAEQFDEVLDYLREEYIEEKFDENRAYVSAANFALSLIDPAYELVPEDFHAKHKGDPEVKFEGADRDEISLKRRDYFQQQYEEVQAAWGPLKFGRKEFERVLKFVEEKGSKGEKKVPSSRIWLAAAQGFLYALDPHSSLVSKKGWEESNQETQDASFEGIGALLTQRFEPGRTLKNRLAGTAVKLARGDRFVLVALKEDDKLQRRTFVESPIAGQPAEKAGVWAGDEIVKVDGKSTVDLPLDDVVAMIRGKSGTVVKLTVLREGVNGEIEIPVYRAPIKVTNVEGRLLEHHPCIAWVKLTGFIDTSFDELKAKILELDGECKEGGGLRGLVFDLRNNSGGLLTQGVRISDLFLETGRIVTVKNRRRAGGLFAFMEPQDEVYTAKKKGTLMVPMVVLVNDGSASAAEIVASALQDNGRALIVGERTFGKASVQTLINPMKGEGYYVKLTIARYYGPSGRTLQVVGVMPDVEVPPDPGATKMPLGFREEDLSNHLAELDHDYVSANRAVTDEIRPCVEKRGIAERIVKDDPRPQIRFDMQLFRGADYLECLIDEVQAHGGVMPGAPPVEEAPAVPTVPALPPPGAAL